MHSDAVPFCLKARTPHKIKTLLFDVLSSAQDDDEFADVMPDGDDPDAKEFTASITHGEKPVLFSHLYIKPIMLPRQARDKHRENSKKETVLSQGLSRATSRLAAG
jgi:hypothetical protein